ncbi:hypothetical protein ABFS83_03G007700 [Erythranthe nasuta]
MSSHRRSPPPNTRSISQQFAALAKNVKEREDALNLANARLVELKKKLASKKAVMGTSIREVKFIKNLVEEYGFRGRIFVSSDLPREVETFAIIHNLKIEYRESIVSKAKANDVNGSGNQVEEGGA